MLRTICIQAVSQCRQFSLRRADVDLVLLPADACSTRQSFLAPRLSRTEAHGCSTARQELSGKPVCTTGNTWRAVESLGAVAEQCVYAPSGLLRTLVVLREGHLTRNAMNKLRG